VTKSPGKNKNRPSQGIKRKRKEEAVVRKFSTHKKNGDHKRGFGIGKITVTNEKKIFRAPEERPRDGGQIKKKKREKKGKVGGKKINKRRHQRCVE